MIVTIVINGERRETAEDATIDSLLAALGLSGKRVAVELNGRVLRRPEWAAAVLRDSDRVELVQFVGGG